MRNYLLRKMALFYNDVRRNSPNQVDFYNFRLGRFSFLDYYGSRVVFNSYTEISNDVLKPRLTLLFHLKTFQSWPFKKRKKMKKKTIQSENFFCCSCNCRTTWQFHTFYLPPFLNMAMRVKIFSTLWVQWSWTILNMVGMVITMPSLRRVS